MIKSKPTFPFDDLIRIYKNCGTAATEAEVREATWDEFALTGKHARTLFDYWFDNNYRRLSIQEVRTGGTVTIVDAGKRGRASTVTTFTPPKRKTPAERAAQKSKITRLANRVSQIALMDLRTSTGKRIRDCTFAEIKKEAGWLGAIAKLGKPNQIVGEVLTETDIRNIRLRNAA